MPQPLRVHYLPLTPYAEALRWQRETAGVVRAGGLESLALLQHPPVYTFGRRVRPEHLLLDPEDLRDQGTEVVESDRGGDVTFHGPGQLVGYPILDLRRRGLGPAEYVRMLEGTLIRSLAEYSVGAYRVDGRPGVWTEAGKIGAIGVRIQGGVSTHGFALNVDVDLSWFEAIVPCGIAGAPVTSMQALLGAGPDVDAVAGTVVHEFATAFGCTLVEAPREAAAVGR